MMAAGDGAPSAAPAAGASDAAAATPAPPVAPTALAGGADAAAATAGGKAATLAELEAAATTVPITVLFPAEGAVYTAAADPTQPVRQLLHAVPRAHTELAPAPDGAAGGPADGAAGDGVPSTEVRSFVFRRMVVTQSQLDEYMRTLAAVRNPQRPAWLSMLLARQTGGRARDKPYVPPADARWRLFHNGRRLRFGRTVAESDLRPGGAVPMLGVIEGLGRRRVNWASRVPRGRFCRARRFR